MSKNLQSEEKYELRYKATRELIWGFGFYILGSLGGNVFISVMFFVAGTISLVLSFHHNWKLK